jgi:hypothetical protein
VLWSVVAASRLAGRAHRRARLAVVMDGAAHASAVAGVDDGVSLDLVGVPLAAHAGSERDHEDPSGKHRRLHPPTSSVSSRGRASRFPALLVGFAAGALICGVALSATTPRTPSPSSAPTPSFISSFALPLQRAHASAPAPTSRDAESRSRLLALTAENTRLVDRLADADASVDRLWRVIDVLRLRAAAAFSLATRETCDAETLAPLCEGLKFEPQRNLPARVRSRTSDFRMRRLWGSPADDPGASATNLLAITVGVRQMRLVDSVVRAFDLDDFVVVLFHYDGEVDAWRELPWSDRAIHVSAWKQTKWWFAKRFLHPDVVAAYDRVFLWDEDIDVETDGFDPREYVRIARVNGLEISQPALVAGKGAWPVTRRVTVRGADGDVVPEMHRLGKDWRGQPCLDADGNPRLKPPCAAYVEIMVPVFTRRAWRCVWSMIQNDLTHGWGLDLTWHRCAEDASRNQSAVNAMGVIDAQGVRHLGAPTLGEQGETAAGVSGRVAVSRRRAAEWDLYNARWKTPDLVAAYDLESTQRQNLRDAEERLARVAGALERDREEAARRGSTTARSAEDLNDGKIPF